MNLLTKNKYSNIIIVNLQCIHDLNLFPVIAIIQENVAVTVWPGVLTTSQLLDLEFQIEAVSPQQLTVLLGQLVVGAGGADLLVLHQVHHLQHLETDLVHQALGILGQQHDLLEVQSVTQAPHWLPALNTTVADIQFTHFLHDCFSLQCINVATLFNAKFPDAGALCVTALQLSGSLAHLVQPAAQLLETGVQLVTGHVEIFTNLATFSSCLASHGVVGENVGL